MGVPSHYVGTLIYEKTSPATARQWIEQGVPAAKGYAFEMVRSGTPVSLITELTAAGVPETRLDDFMRANGTVQDAHEWTAAGLPLDTSALVDAVKAGVNAQALQPYMAEIPTTGQLFDPVGFAFKNAVSRVDPKTCGRFSAYVGGPNVYSAWYDGVWAARRWAQVTDTEEAVQWMCCGIIPANKQEAFSGQDTKPDWQTVRKWRRKLGADAIYYARAGLTLEEATQARERGDIETIKVLAALRER